MTITAQLVVFANRLDAELPALCRADERNDSVPY
jgi:hypothetical protein